MKYLQVKETSAEVVNPELDFPSVFLSKEDNIVTVFDNVGYVLFFLENESTATTTTINEVLADGSLTTLELENHKTNKVFGLDNGFCSTPHPSDWESNGFDGLCGLISSIDLSHYNPSNLTTLRYMFGGYMNVHNFDVSNFDVSNVTSTQGMFAKSGVINLDLSSWDMSNVTNTDYMFYGSSIKTIILPNSITVLGNKCFSKCGLTSVGLEGSGASLEIPNSVTNIEAYAFDNCARLTSVTIPDSVTSIKTRTFEKCISLSTIEIPNSVTSIEEGAFLECSGLTSVTIPNSVTSIDSYAFCYCKNLTSITIPNSVTSMGKNPFMGCVGVTEITVNSNNSLYDSRNNCNAIIKTDTNTLIVGCKNTIIPNSVTSIGDSAFGYCSVLTSVTIPNSVTSIEEDAFFYCSSLVSIEIPNSVTSIETYAFAYCKNLTSVTISNSVTSIAKGLFSYCSVLTSVTIPKSVTTIGQSAFSYCASLSIINFTGTKAQWNAITKGSYWKQNVPATVVTCTDGTVSL